MSKKCIWCGGEVNPNVIQGMYYCPRCDEDLTDKDVLPLTVFDYITQSEEKLAERLVHNKMYMVQNGVLQYWVSSYFSTILPDKSWEYESEAIEATIKELKKEVENDCKI